jgi:hypothetical protein
VLGGGDVCRTHQVEPIKFTYQLAGRSPQLCIECHLDADIKKLALAFPGGTRLLNLSQPGFYGLKVFVLNARPREQSELSTRHRREIGSPAKQLILNPPIGLVDGMRVTTASEARPIAGM